MDMTSVGFVKLVSMGKIGAFIISLRWMKNL